MVFNGFLMIKIHLLFHIYKVIRAMVLDIGITALSDLLVYS